MSEEEPPIRHISLEELQKILEQHRLWLESSEQDGARADLSHANLSDAFLSGADLRSANLSGASLNEADLFGADLYEASLFRADLSATRAAR